MSDASVAAALAVGAALAGGLAIATDLVFKLKYTLSGDHWWRLGM